MKSLFDIFSKFFSNIFPKKKLEIKPTNYRGYERAEAFSPPPPAKSSSVSVDPKIAETVEKVKDILDQTAANAEFKEDTVKVEVEPTPKQEIFDTPKEADKTFRYPTAAVGITDDFVVPRHMGIDLGFFRNRGGIHTPIISATPGKVVKVWNFSDAGLTVRVRYDDNDISWYAQYKHLYRADVKVGDILNVGDPIGLMGDSGGYAGEYHLHFDLIKCPLGYSYTQASVSERKKYSVDPTKHLYLKDKQFVGDDTKAKYTISDGKLVKKKK